MLHAQETLLQRCKQLHSGEFPCLHERSSLSYTSAHAHGNGTMIVNEEVDSMKMLMFNTPSSKMSGYG